MTVALVTGGSRGIGAAIVKAFRDAGYKVASVSRTLADCDYCIRADLSQIHERAFIVNAIVDTMGGLDILVNNAGSQGHRPFVETEITQWNDKLELMLTAPFDLSQQAAKYMLRHGGGHIVNILSTSSFQGARNIAPYVAAKHGLLGLTRAMAIELAPDIHVNAVAPGLTATNMTDEYISADRRKLLESITPAGRFGRPEEIADAVLWLTRTSYVYGQTIIADGGWLAKNG